MKKTFVMSVATVCSVMTLCSCQGDVMNDLEPVAEPTSVLHVFTRNGDDPAVAANVPTPVSLYVFDAGGKCVSLVSDVVQNALVPIAGGTYDICAVAGADAARYVLPSQSEASKTSVLSLQTGQTLGDLMTSQARVTVADATEHNLTISLTRAVAGIKQIAIKKVPSAVTAVTVDVAPLYESLVIDGTYSGANGSYRATLTKEADGTTWSFTGGDDGPFFLPSVGKPTVTVSFTTAGSTTSYSYAAPEELVANHKLSIDGTYTEQAKLKITGSITGSEWGEDQTISFEFDETSATGTSTGGGSQTGGESDGESGSDSGSSGTSQTVTLPAVGSTYRTCYVLAHVDETHVLLLAPNHPDHVVTSSDESDAALDKMTSCLSEWDVDGITSWTYLDWETAKLVSGMINDIKDFGIEITSAKPALFLYNDGNVMGFCNKVSGIDYKPSFTDMYQLLGMTTLEISN